MKMDNRGFMALLNKVAEYISGMWIEPKYILLKTLFTIIIPNISVPMFLIISKLR